MITTTVFDKIYGALCKLQDYEDTGLSPKEVERLKDVPDTNAGKWIPVEERLPEKEEFLEAYIRNVYAAEFLVTIKGATRPTTLYFRGGEWFDDYAKRYGVLAWQPLPEPYRLKKEIEETK